MAPRWRSRRWFVWLLAGLVTGTACRRNPAAPSIELNLTPGLQSVRFVGPGPSSAPQIPPCAPPGVPAGGTSITTQVMLTQEGTGWVARSPSSDVGSIELRFRPTAESDEGYLVSGSARGVALDRGSDTRPPADVTFTIAGSGSRGALVGTVERSGVVVRGIISGTVSFSDSHGAQATCAGVQWVMQPVVLP